MAATTRVLNIHGVDLPSPRYEIRKIGPEVAEWCKALTIYGFLLRTSIWTPIIPEPKPATALKALENLSDYFDHAINSGLSYGIFDTEYQYKRPQSVGTGGALYWAELDPQDSDLAEEMIEGMDFPLVSLALTYDFFYQRKADFEPPMLELIPLHPQVMMLLGQADPRPSESWLPHAAGEVVCRTGTVTKPGYERQGLMGALSKFVILQLKHFGFRGLIIGTAGSAVHRVYTEPPNGVKSTVLHHYDVEAMELEEQDGRKIRPYVGSDLKEGWLVWLDLAG